jgi:hypothetical protein
LPWLSRRYQKFRDEVLQWFTRILLVLYCQGMDSGSAVVDGTWKLYNIFLCICLISALPVYYCSEKRDRRWQRGLNIVSGQHIYWIMNVIHRVTLS